jgi:hypothetical protein
MLVEVMFLPCLDILEENPYESLSVFATLLMPETNGMTNLMDRAALVAPWSQRDKLLTNPSHANR